VRKDDEECNNSDDENRGENRLPRPRSSFFSPSTFFGGEEGAGGVGTGGGSNSLAVPAASYGRRRSRAVLYQLSGHYSSKPDNKVKSKLGKINSVSLLVIFTDTV
jgi:hypothetical protein